MLECPPELNLSALPQIWKAMEDAKQAAAMAAQERGVAPENAAGPSEPFGICLSGGGVRSASYCLGVLQEMDRRGLLHGETKASYLASVSGGSYIAGAFAMVNRGAYSNEPPDRSDPRRGSMPTIAPGAIQAFAPMSPEERYLRDHTRYLTHGFGGILGAVWRLLVGIMWNIVILSLGVGAIAVPIGWIYGAAIPSLRAECGPLCGPHHLALEGWVFWVAGGLGLAGLGAGMTWVIRQWRHEGTRRTLGIVSLGLLGLGALWMLFAVAFPLLLEWIRASVGAHGANHQIPPDNSTAAVGAVSGAGTLASMLTAVFGVRAVRTAQSVWSKVPSSDKQTVTNKAKTWLLKARTPLLNLLAALIAPTTIFAIAVLFLHVGSLYRPLVLGGTGVWAFCGWLGGLVFLFALWWLGDLNSWSMHPFYRERLSAAFALKRFRACQDVWSPTASWEGEELVDATRRPYDVEYRISDTQTHNDFPEFLICAAANVSKYGATPTKAPVSSFVFSARDVGGPVIGAWPAETYENVLGRTLKRNVTFPAAVAMSGAAISPEMGRMTRAPLRFLLAMLNIRLGLWIPNPNRLAEFEARSHSWIRRRRLVPRITYLLREMFGLNDPESKFLYVTDGGHYENLGLVELLRRRCRYIWCVDASGEQQDGFSTIAGAIALAFSELGARIDIDPARDMTPDPAVTEQRVKTGLKPVVKSTFCHGTIHYDPKDPSDIARLVIIKTGVPEDAPQDVADFYEHDSKAFPCDPTLDQFFTADRFDAYRSLGAFAAEQALDACWADFSEYRTAGKPPPEFLPCATPPGGRAIVADEGVVPN